MKSTGIVRKLDQLGRIVLPMELRKTLEIDIGDPLGIYVDGNLIILKKFVPECIFCGEARNVENYMGKNICPKCAENLKKSLDINA